MSYLLVSVLAFIGGGIVVSLALNNKRNRLAEEARICASKEASLRESEDKLEKERRHLVKLAKEVEHFKAKVISYNELEGESAILKRDLRNLAVHVNKTQLDLKHQQRAQDEIDGRAVDLGKRYLTDNVKWIGANLTANNFTNSKARLSKTITACRGIGFEISAEEESELHDDLKQQYEMVVRAALEREEQARIKAQIREEQKLEREIERELKQLERERLAIKAALDEALAKAKDEHSEEIERLRARLAEAEERSQRAISQAQLTKSGHVYVVSNIGSFGQGVFKIGVTRRLEPLERVKELGDASVPFPFDVHMMISSDNAPQLESLIHTAIDKSRVNKVNRRKEFFNTDIETIRQIVEKNHGEVQYVVDAEALEYHESIEMSQEDEEFIRSTYEKLTEGTDTAPIDE